MQKTELEKESQIKKFQNEIENFELKMASSHNEAEMNFQEILKLKTIHFEEIGKFLVIKIKN